MKRQYRVYSSRKIVASFYDEHPTTVEGVAEFILKRLGGDQSGVYGYSIESDQVVIRGVFLSWTDTNFSVRTCSFSIDEIENIANDTSSSTTIQLTNYIRNEFFYGKDLDKYDVPIVDMSLDEVFEGFDTYDFSSSYEKDQVEFALEHGMSKYMYNNLKRTKVKKPGNFNQLLNEFIAAVKEYAQDEYGFNIEVKKTTKTITYYAYEGEPSKDNLVSYFRDKLVNYDDLSDEDFFENSVYGIVEDLANDNSGEVKHGPKF